MRGVEQLWATGDAEQRLLYFVASLIIDAAHTDPRMTQPRIALWLARVVVGHGRKVNQ